MTHPIANAITHEIECIDKSLAHGIDQIIAEFRLPVLRGLMNQVIHNKEGGEITRGFDWLIEDRLIRLIEETGLPFRIDSEERGLLDLASSPRYLAIIDPLDGSDMAARGYPLCCISVSVVDLDSLCAVVSRIGEFSTGDQYFATTVSCGHTARSLRPSRIERIEQAFVVSYAAKRERIAKISNLMPLIAGCGLYLNYGGPLDIARIATGQVDLFVETVKGMMPRDTLSGMHILSRSGGVILDLDGGKIDGDRLQEGRRMFVAAGNEVLARDAVRRLCGDRSA